VTMDEILMSAPGVLRELTSELIRRADQEYRKDQESQAMACLYLSLRSASLLGGMTNLLTPFTRDSSEVLVRGFIEARDLLLSFRFDHKGTRTKIGYWFDGKADSAWKPEHRKCDEYMAKPGYPGAEFAKRWSMATALAHPTIYASRNSTVTVSLWAANPPRVEDFNTMMEPKIADYLTCIATLIVIATHDLPDLISLECDLDRMPHIDAFRENVMKVVVPILNKYNQQGGLPPTSYRT
jgi:hypothetical protein